MSCDGSPLSLFMIVSISLFKRSKLDKTDLYNLLLVSAIEFPRLYPLECVHTNADSVSLLEIGQGR